MLASGPGCSAIAARASARSGAMGPPLKLWYAWVGDTEMSDSALPAALRRRSDIEAIADDIAPYLGTTVAERSEIMGELCRLAAEQVAAHPQGHRILEFQESRSQDSMALWMQLVAEAGLLR